jgi:rSAM/selenodomain-associated transferase 2
MLNEQHAIGTTLDSIMRAAPAAEIIIVDGGSSDSSVEIARARLEARITRDEPLAALFPAQGKSDGSGRPGDILPLEQPEGFDRAGNFAALSHILIAPRGRARQMNAGGRVAHGEVLVFVHADTLVPPIFSSDICAALVDPGVVGGRFDLELDEPSFIARLLGKLISLRSRIMRSATGDQAIFVRRDIFIRLGGFAEIDLCEDVDFARRLKRSGRIACVRSRVITSARRWRRNGLFRTVIRMWVIKSLFLAGVSPAKLRRHYADTR